MAKEIREWLCGVCKAKFESKEEAEECETIHTSVSEIVKEVHTPRCPHPRYVDILMNDGKKHRYEYVLR